MSLRFSRRRFSQTLGGTDVPAGDPHGTAQGPRTYLSNTADAAVYVYPRCDLIAGGKTDAKCLPGSAFNCFPWCMGLHVAGRKNQQIVLYAQDTWENNVNVAKTDCAIDADEALSRSPLCLSRSPLCLSRSSPALLPSPDAPTQRRSSVSAASRT